MTLPEAQTVLAEHQPGPQGRHPWPGRSCAACGELHPCATRTEAASVYVAGGPGDVAEGIAARLEAMKL